MKAAALFDAGAWGRLMDLEVATDATTGLLAGIRPSPDYAARCREPFVPGPPNPAIRRIDGYIQSALVCPFPLRRQRTMAHMLQYIARDPEALDLLLSAREVHVRLRAMVFERSLVGWWADTDGAPRLKGAARLLLHRATAAQLKRRGCGAEWAATLDAVRGAARSADSRLSRLPEDVLETHLLPLLGDTGIERVFRGFQESLRRRVLAQAKDPVIQTH